MSNVISLFIEEKTEEILKKNLEKELNIELTQSKKKIDYIQRSTYGVKLSRDSTIDGSFYSQNSFEDALKKARVLDLNFKAAYYSLGIVYILK